MVCLGWQEERWKCFGDVLGLSTHCLEKDDALVLAVFPELKGTRGEQFFFNPEQCR